MGSLLGASGKSNVKVSIINSLLIGDRSGLKTQNLVKHLPTPSPCEIFVSKLRHMAVLVCVAGTVLINVSVIC